MLRRLTALFAAISIMLIFFSVPASADKAALYEDAAGFTTEVISFTAEVDKEIAVGADSVKLNIEVQKDGEYKLGFS